MKNKDTNNQVSQPFDAECCDDVRDGFGSYYTTTDADCNFEGCHYGYGVDGQPSELACAEYTENHPKLIELNKD